jgi:uncharacterized Ntn-hydrolase superfamily protein
MTYTFLALDPSREVIGIVTASRSLAVGCSVPALDPAHGAVASQSWTNRVLRHLMLRELALGVTPDDAVARLPELDAGADHRQVGVLDVAGRGAAWTGAASTGWAGHVVGDGFVALGNLLAGPEVVDAMVGTFRERGARLTTADGASPDVPLAAPDPGAFAHDTYGPSDGDDPVAVAHARMLLAVLEAGEAAGGDVRGRQSASLQVARVRTVAIWPPQIVVDLRVDDDADPVGELARLLELREADLAQPSNGETAPRTIVTPSEAFAHQWGVEQP